MSPFPEIIKTRINGCKVKSFIYGKWVMAKVVRPEMPSVIWLHWIRRIGERQARQQAAR